MLLLLLLFHIIIILLLLQLNIIIISIIPETIHLADRSEGVLRIGVLRIDGVYRVAGLIDYARKHIIHIFNRMDHQLVRGGGMGGFSVGGSVVAVFFLVSCRIIVCAVRCLLCMQLVVVVIVCITTVYVVQMGDVIRIGYREI